MSRRTKGSIGLLTLGALAAGGFVLYSMSASSSSSAATVAPPPNVTVSPS